MSVKVTSITQTVYMSMTVTVTVISVTQTALKQKTMHLLLKAASTRNLPLAWSLWFRLSLAVALQPSG